MKLWMGNIAPGTSDDEIKEFLKKYAPDLECATIARIEGAGNRPAAMIQFQEGSKATLDHLGRRLNGMYWKGRSLVSTVYMV
jgi:RNA recognition motif-containing protein